MSQYYSYNDFMTKVLEEADSMTKRQYGVGLDDFFDVSSLTYNSTYDLISNGWSVFIAVVALFAVGPLGLTFAIGSLLTTPVGLVILAVLGVSAISVIRTMYKERILPEAVKAVGEEFKKPWEDADGNRSLIDKLRVEAANRLCERANRFNI